LTAAQNLHGTATFPRPANDRVDCAFAARSVRSRLYFFKRFIPVFALALSAVRPLRIFVDGQRQALRGGMTLPADPMASLAPDFDHGKRHQHTFLSAPSYRLLFSQSASASARTFGVVIVQIDLCRIAP